jgi:hypothetical protein
MAEAGHLPGVVEVGITIPLGQQVMRRNSFRDRLGYVIACAANKEEAARVADTGLELLSARIVPRLDDGPGHHARTRRPHL